jgi:transcription antitermination protein NusB
MSARSKSRKRALDYLYAAEMRGEALPMRLEADLVADELPNNPYTEELVRGVAENQTYIDDVLSRYAQDWVLGRMPAVDRNALRIGVFEILFSDEVPGAVAVNEAIALARLLSTDESPQFVNGVLGAVLRDQEMLRATR